jgi:hypothetical protein
MNKSETLLQAALDLAARGFRVFPLSPGTAIPPKDYPWKSKATTDEAEIRSVWNGAEWNIGVATGEFTVVDLDVKNGKDGIFEALELGLNFETFTVSTPSGGLHLYYLDAGYTNRAGTLDLPDGGKAKGVDIRGVGGYVVGPGSETPKGIYKMHTPSAKLLELPKAFAAQLREHSPADAGEKSEGSDSPAAVAAGIEFLKRAPLAVEGEGGDATTVGVIFRLRDYGIAPDTALELLVEHWNDNCSPPWDLEDLREKVNNAFKYAQNTNPSQDPAAMIEGLDGLTPPPAPSAPDKTKPEFDFLTLTSVNKLPAPAWLIKRTLPEVGIAAIWGPSGSGKSLVAQDLIVAVGSGNRWCGSKTAAQGGTLLIAAEAADILGPRLRAAKVAETMPLIWADAPGFFTQDNSWEVFAKLINAGREELATKFGATLRVVMIDTFSAAGVVQDENDNGQMQRAMTLLTQYAKKANILVVLVHHTDKAGKEMRGASAMRGALDSSISVSRGDGRLRHVKLDKCRRAPERDLGTFVVEEDVFRDLDGDVDTVPRLQWVSEIDVPDVRPRHADNLITALTIKFGKATVRSLVEEFEGLVNLKTGVGAAFNDSLAYLVRKGEVREVGGTVELVKNA